jgi:hypothetical protein
MFKPGDQVIVVKECSIFFRHVGIVQNIYPRHVMNIGVSFDGESPIDFSKNELAKVT